MNVIFKDPSICMLMGPISAALVGTAATAAVPATATTAAIAAIPATAGVIGSAGLVGGVVSTGTVLQLAGLGVTGLSSIRSSQAKRIAAQSEEEQGKFEADQLLQQAGQEQAVAQLAANEEKRQQELLESGLIARSASSGGTQSDIISLLAGIGEEGDLRASTRIFAGEKTAQDLRNRATASLFRGDVASKALKIGSKNDLISAGGNLLTKSSLTFADKFGGKNISKPIDTSFTSPIN